MTIPARPPLGTATLTSTWLLDVDTSSDLSGSWTPVRGISGGSVPQVSVQTDQIELLNGGRWSYGVRRGRAWAGSLTLTRKKTPDGTAYDPGQEYLRAAIETDPGTVHIRWYKNDGVNVEAYDGIAVVDYAGQGGGAADLDTVQVTLTGQGPRNLITHPALG